MAQEYAKLGARLAIVARREEKLEDVAETCRLEIRSLCGLVLFQNHSFFDVTLNHHFFYIAAKIFPVASVDCQKLS